jgi:hypothetical protein
MSEFYLLATGKLGDFGLVIADSLSACISGDENLTSDARTFVRAAECLGKQLGCPVLVIHHTSRAGDGARGKARSSRGNLVFEQRSRFVLKIESDEPRELAVVKLNNHDKANVPPRTFDLVVDNSAGTAQIVIGTTRSTANRTAGGPVRVEEVATVLRAAENPLSLSGIRTEVAKNRGKKAGSKADENQTRAALEKLIVAGQAHESAENSQRFGWGPK